MLLIYFTAWHFCNMKLVRHLAFDLYGLRNLAFQCIGYALSFCSLIDKSYDVTDGTRLFFKDIQLFTYCQTVAHSNIDIRVRIYHLK